MLRYLLNAQTLYRTEKTAIDIYVLSQNPKGLYLNLEIPENHFLSYSSKVDRQLTDHHLSTACQLLSTLSTLIW